METAVPLEAEDFLPESGRAVTPLRLERSLIPPPKKINALLSPLIRIWR